MATLTLTEVPTANTTNDWICTDAVYASEAGLWVLLGVRSPAHVEGVQTSPDRTTWTLRALPSTTVRRAIAYAPSLGTVGRLVTVGNGVADWSDDGGETWTSATSLPSANNWIDVVWWPAQDIFVACAITGSSRIMTSADGKSWTDQTAAAAKAWSGLAVSETIAVCVAFDASAGTQLVQTSTDGTTWALETHDSLSTNRGLVGGAGQRLGVGYSDTLDMFLFTGTVGGVTKAYRSTDDGATWSASDAIPTIGDSTNRGYVWMDGVGWYMPCANRHYGESSDGIAWSVTVYTDPPVSNSGYTPMGWDGVSHLVGGTTLGFDTALIVSVTEVGDVTPARGTALGGTVCTITGLGFTGVTSVLFGGTAAVGVVVDSDTSLTCITPAHAVGLVDVEVVGVGTLEDAYTFVSVTRVSPNRGTTFGGTAVTITGFGFELATGVTFGGVSATSIVFVSPTTITAVTPEHASGAVDVTVVGVDTLTAGYTYTIAQAALPPIPYLSPVEGETLGRVSNPWFLWLTTLKQRVEGLPGSVPAESVIGVLSVNNIPELPFTKILLDTAPRLLGRTSTGAGEAEEIRVAGGLVLTNGILSLAGVPGGYVIGDLLYADSDHTLARLADVSAGSYLRSGGVATAPLWSTLKLPNAATVGNILKASGADVYASVAPEALTKTDDTNVTLTLGGSASSALVNAASITAGWTGTLAPSRGGTGTGTAFTAGSVVFAGASGVYSQDNAALFWDAANKRLGVGTASPNSTLECFGILTIRDGFQMRWGTVGVAGLTGISGAGGYFDFAANGSALARFYEGAKFVFGNGIHSTVLSKTNSAAIENFLAIGTTAFPSTGTATLVFGDGTAPATMGSNTAGVYANDVGGTVNMFAINEAGTVTQLSGLTSAYTITNVTTDRSYDANATTLDEIADTLGTLIADLQARGICG